MTPDKLLEFLNKGGIKALLIVIVVYGYFKLETMNKKIDTLQAVVIDCYKERVQDMTLRGAGLTKHEIERKQIFAVLPCDPVGKIKRF